MNSLIERGPLTIVLVFRSTCPHCVTYKPIWKDLCEVKGRKAHMISMESDVYMKTPLSEKKEVTGVPTVLYVNSAGEIEEVETPRDTAAMTEFVKSASPLATEPIRPTESPKELSISELPSEASESVLPSEASESVLPSELSDSVLPSELSEGSEESEESEEAPALTIDTTGPEEQEKPKIEEEPEEPEEAASLTIDTTDDAESKPSTSLFDKIFTPVVPDTEVKDSELKITPAETVSSEKPTPAIFQTGGDPWTALLFAAKQAAPAAALLGAYATLPAKRSSGLGAPKRRSRRRSHKK